MGLLSILKGEQPGFFNSLLNYKNAGQFGEYMTEYALKNNNLKGEYIVLKNIYVPVGNQNTEIDLLMIHEKGIFVFESKNYSGFIYGKFDELNWVQKIKNRNKYVFYNPIKQNNTHIIALANYLRLPSSAFTSYIVFSERCKLKEVPKSTEQIVVLKRNKMLKTLRKTLKNRKIIYTKEQIKQFKIKLNPLTNVSEQTKQQHIKDIKKKYETNVCPFCGKKLIKRIGKYGQFIGCTGYPKCKYTRQIDK